MFTIAICDDDQIFTAILKDQLEHLCFDLPEMDIRIQNFCRAQDLLQYLKRHIIQIVFLAIETPHINSFSLAESLYRKYPEIIIIYMSCRQDMVHDSIKHPPFRFMRKNRLKAELPEVFQAALTKYLENKSTCLFHTTEGDLNLILQHILYLESQKNYCILHCLNADYKCRGSLSEMESLLTDHGFYRIHASFLVNMEYIKALPVEKKIILTDGTELSISRSKAADFRNKYIDFLQRKASP